MGPLWRAPSHELGSHPMRFGNTPRARRRPRQPDRDRSPSARSASSSLSLGTNRWS